MKYLMLPQADRPRLLPFYFAVEEYVANTYTDDDYFFILNSATHIVRNKFKILSNNILPGILPCQKIHLT